MKKTTLLRIFLISIVSLSLYGSSWGYYNGLINDLESPLSGYVKVSVDGHTKEATIVVPFQAPVVNFQIADIDDTPPLSYYGYLDAQGGWYIMQDDTSITVEAIRFARGTSEYTSNWGSREVLNYGYYDGVF